MAPRPDPLLPRPAAGVGPLRPAVPAGVRLPFRPLPPRLPSPRRCPRRSSPTSGAVFSLSFPPRLARCRPRRAPHINVSPLPLAAPRPPSRRPFLLACARPPRQLSPTLSASSSLSYCLSLNLSGPGPHSHRGLGKLFLAWGPRALPRSRRTIMDGLQGATPPPARTKAQRLWRWRRRYGRQNVFNRRESGWPARSYRWRGRSSALNGDSALPQSN